MSDMKEKIMALARSTVQAYGYGGLSFRELAKEIGIKSASIHYYFPTKGDLGAAIARQYTEDSSQGFEQAFAENPQPADFMRRYTAMFRRALEMDNRMCLCGIMAAEADDLPDEVKTEVVRFGDVNITWLTRVLEQQFPEDLPLAAKKAAAVYAAVAGAQLIARSRNDIGVFDQIIETYRTTGFFE